MTSYLPFIFYGELNGYCCSLLCCGHNIKSTWISIVTNIRRHWIYILSVFIFFFTKIFYSFIYLDIHMYVKYMNYFIWNFTEHILNVIGLQYVLLNHLIFWYEITSLYYTVFLKIVFVMFLVTIKTGILDFFCEIK